MRIAIIGGGAAGFFAALAAKEAAPSSQVFLLEKSAKPLAKVRISGGGRCNVTHACFDPKRLIEHYPRGAKELLGPFHHFQPRDTITWFERRGVPLKEEKDGRIFPVSNSSESIISCLLQEAKRLNVQVEMQAKIEQILPHFSLERTGKPPLEVDRVILATGSSKEGFLFAEKLGHTIEAPVPSLFTFNIPSSKLLALAGVTVDKVTLSLKESRLRQSGSLLITHAGFSGPATLKLSAFGARFLAGKNYETVITVDWLPDFSEDQMAALLLQMCQDNATKQIGNAPLPGLPKRLWTYLVERAELSSERVLRTLQKGEMKHLIDSVKHDEYQVQGKTTNKEEFVTCGGIKLSEVNFKKMESRLCPHLFFCGEILDIDGVTGGFNFQNAWTTGWIAGNNIVL